MLLHPEIKSENSDPPPNRLDRRSVVKPPGSIRELTEAYDSFFSSQDQRIVIAKKIKADEISLASVLYSDENPLLVFAEAQRRLYVALGSTVKYESDPRASNFIKGCKKINLFARPVRGLSLVDIEGMQLPLSEVDIIKMNKMLRYYRLFASVDAKGVITQEMSWSLPTLSLARTQFLDKTKNKPIPSSLQALNSSMKNL